MSLHLHRAERADVLVDALGEVLAVPLADPFATEVVCVPTPGRRALDRPAAGPPPRRRRGRRRRLRRCRLPLAAPAGADRARGRAAATTPGRPSRAVWPLLAVLEEAVAEPWGRGARRLPRRAGPAATDAAPGADPRRSRRWSTARRLAGLFARYAADRPTMLAAWAAGDATGPDGSAARRPTAPGSRSSGAGSARASAAPTRSSACAWRVDRLPATPTSRRTRRRRCRTGCRSSARRTWTRGTSQVLLALAVRRDVHLWLPHASPAAWDAVAAAPLDRRAACCRCAPTTPWATWSTTRCSPTSGRDSRELQVRLRLAAAAAGVTVVDTHHAPPSRAHRHADHPPAPAAGRPGGRPGAGRRPRARRPATRASSCTPAPARTGRSRCSGRSSSASSPTTRPSSRATSS